MIVVANKLPIVMNKTEARYARVLKERQLAGEITSYGYENYKLVWGPHGKRVTYTPDFSVVVPTGLHLPSGQEVSLLEFHEVKGFWRDDARVKIKTVADLFPHSFVAVQHDKGVWRHEHFSQEVQNGV